MIRLTFLGTAAARPTVSRNVSSIAVQREGDLMLFDCGEGTQRQMMRYGTGFAVGAIFLTHLHADHFLGIVGLLLTMALQGREDAIEIYGPPGSQSVLTQAVRLGVERVQFPIEIIEAHPGDAISRIEYEIQPFEVDHGMPAVGYALRENPRLGRFDVDRARALGIPEGPLFGDLHRGESVEVGDRIITPDELVGPPRPGRVVVYTGDSRPCPGTREAATGADLLIHDSTFDEDEVRRAHETFHTTAAGAATLAKEAQAKALILTHISARYSDSVETLQGEAQEIFPNSRVARDGMVVELPITDDA